MFAVDIAVARYAHLHQMYVWLCVLCSCDRQTKTKEERTKEKQKKKKRKKITQRRDDDGSANRLVMGYSGQAINLAHRTFYQPVNINLFVCIVVTTTTSAAAAA